LADDCLRQYLLSTDIALRLHQQPLMRMIDSLDEVMQGDFAVALVDYIQFTESWSMARNVLVGVVASACKTICHEFRKTRLRQILIPN